MLSRFIKNSFSTLVLAEHNGSKLSSNTLKVLSASRKLNQKSDILLISEDPTNIISSINQTVPSQLISRIITVNSKRALSDIVSSVVEGLHKKHSYKFIVAGSSSYGKDVIPRLAGKFNSQPITDIIEVIDEKTFVRPTYAGNALSKVQSSQDVNFLTFRASSFEELPHGTNTTQVQKVQDPTEKLTQFIKQQKSDSSKPDLTTAKIVVSGGRGVKSKQNFKVIYDLAQAFGSAAVGASRAAVDSGYCPNEMQVGQTGKVVAPQLYIACGISGAVQHLAGMKDSKIIVAINQRADEPIFQVANYGLQADLFKAVPQLTEKIKKLKAA